MNSVDFKESLYKRLKNNPELCLAYLNEALLDEDPRVFLLALKDVIEAKSSVLKISKLTNLNREHIYKMLSEEGNPTTTNLLKISKALNLNLQFVPQENLSATN